MNTAAKKVAQFGILTALALVLGALDRAIPLAAVLGSSIPGLKLGLANTVLLYAVYGMSASGSVLLMLAKVLLSGFLFGSPSAMLYSLAGGVLSLAVMQAVKHWPKGGMMAACAVCAVCEGMLLRRYTNPRGPVLWSMIVIAAAGIGALGLFFLVRKQGDMNVIATSVAGAVAHNIGQILMAAWMLRTPQLLWSYLPFLAGIGAAVGALTGLIARRVFRAIGWISNRKRSAEE